VELDAQLVAAAPLSAGSLGQAAPDRNPLHDTFVVVAPCDQPHLGASLIAAMISALRAAPDHIVVAAPRTPDGRRQPLPTVWRASEGPVLERLIAGGARRADAGITDENVVEVAATDRDVRDVDTPGDLEGLDDWDRAAGGEAPPLRWGVSGADAPAPPSGAPSAPSAAPERVGDAHASASPDPGDPLRWEPPA
jgi:hypothetical protein